MTAPFFGLACRTLPTVTPDGTDTAITRERQYQRDLETLSRIEDERLCFFCAMGDLHAQQKREAGL
jgi:hypothetical protein